MLHESYRRQVTLLIKMIPLVAEEECFALKGGTAINLFVRNMPRLSVDIDLTYLPVASRPESLASIDAALKRLAQRIRKTVSAAKVTFSETKPENTVVKLIVRQDRTQVKIEVTPVLRGCVYEPELRPVAEAVEEAFGFAEMPVVSFADLYAGKINAALDRQHPRDLFDVRDLLDKEGIGDDLRRAFVVYLVSQNRPLAELLAPTRRPIGDEFLHGFDGMTDREVTLDELLATREEMVASIVGCMPAQHRQFLLSFETGTPDWQLLGVPGAHDLPAVRWRQRNLETLAARERARLVSQLESVFAAAPAYLTA